MKNEKHYDLFVIGGGVNGCGVARDAIGRGYSVGLAEMSDLASGTSSASTKLIHGGLRYLEQYAFRLVREALMEREVIWHMAPHLVRPLRFILPYNKGLRPAWMLRLGLFIYDHLGSRHQELWRTKVLDLRKEYGEALKPGYVKGFEYSDARVDDARLVVAIARHAAKLDADIMVRTKVVFLKADGKKWKIGLRNNLNGEERTVTADYLANMAGPWINYVLQDALGFKGRPPVRLVKGSHIVVPKLYEHDRAFIFQNKDGRIVFAIPYQEDFTLIGTTDCDYNGDPAKVHISDEEVDYICKAASEYFIKPVLRESIVWSYSGVRPLYDDGASKAQEATRDYVLKEMKDNNGPIMLNAFGGKITTFRKLSEDALVFVEKALGKRKPAWTAGVSLPGGDFPHDSLSVMEARVAGMLPDLDEKTHRRLARNYGTETLEIFDNGKKDRGQHFGHGLYEAEVQWMMREEWAKDVDDVLWRRSKLGLYFNDKEKESLKEYLEKNKNI